MLGSLREMRGMSADDIGALCSGEGHAPPPLSDDERGRLADATLDGAPDHVRGDYPEWLAPALAEAFGEMPWRRAGRSPPARRSICASTR